MNEEIETNLDNEQEEELTQKKIYEDIENGIQWVDNGSYSGKGTRKDQWKKNKQYLQCVWPGKKKDDVAVNTIFSNYRTKKPTLYFKDPKVTANPIKPLMEMVDGQQMLDENGQPIMVDTYTSAKIFSLKINNTLKKLKFKAIIKKCLGDCICPYGVGYVKVGYSPEIINGVEEITPWIARVDPRNLVFDSFATDIDESRFTAERVMLTKKQAKDQGFVIPEGYTSTLPDFYKDRKNKGDDDTDLVIVWEYRDLESKRKYFVLDDNKKNDGSETSWVKEPENIEEPYEGSCYCVLAINEDNDDIIGLSDVEPIEDQALAINRGRTKMQNHIDNFGTVTVIEEGAIAPNMSEALKSSTMGLMLYHKQGRPAPTVNPTPQMGQDNYQMDGLHKTDMQTSLGITDYQKGTSIARTATEAQYLQQGLGARIEEDRETIKVFIIKIVTRVSCILQKYGSENDYIDLSQEQLTDDMTEKLKKEYNFNPNLPFLKFGRKDYQGEYEYDFAIEDMIMVPKEVQLKQRMEMFGLVTANPEAMKAFKEEGCSIGKLFRSIAELGGINLDELKKGSAVQTSSVKENLMIQEGMELPEPNERDKDDEHNVVHGQLAKQLSEELQGLQSAIQSIAMLEQQNQQMASLNQESAALEAQSSGVEEPQQMPTQPNPQVEEQKKILAQKIEDLSNKLRRITLHMQLHVEKRDRKNSIQAGPAAQISAPQTGAAQAVQMRAQ
jgi:hypothetical protein